MRSLGDGKGEWSEGSKSCSAWAEDAPSDMGALEPLPLLLLCLLWRVPSESSALAECSQGSGGKGEGSLHPPGCSLGALCSDATHRPPAGGVGFVWATPLQRV